MSAAEERCATCDHYGYTPETCPVWSRHPLLGHTGDGNPPEGWSW